MKELQWVIHNFLLWAKKCLNSSFACNVFACAADWSNLIIIKSWQDTWSATHHFYCHWTVWHFERFGIHYFHRRYFLQCRRKEAFLSGRQSQSYKFTHSLKIAFIFHLFVACRHWTRKEPWKSKSRSYRSTNSCRCYHQCSRRY